MIARTYGSQLEIHGLNCTMDDIKDFVTRFGASEIYDGV
jgi:hypothetical protein